MAAKNFISGNWVGGVWDPVGDPIVSDDALLNSGSGNCVINSGAVCRSLDCTGYDGTLSGSDTLTIGDGTSGDVTLSPDMTITSTSIFALVSTVSGNDFTSNGKSIQSINVNGAGGAWTLADAMALAGELKVTSGSLITNGQAVSAQTVNLSGATTRVVTLGASTITVTGSGTCWNAFNGRNATASGITFSAGTSVIALTDTTSTDKSINAAGGLTYGIIRLTMGGTGAFKFNGAATYSAIQTTGTPAAITITFATSTIHTLTGGASLPSGTSGNLVTINSNASDIVCTLDLSGYILSCDYLSVKDVNVTNGTLYCGTHSTNGGNNNENVIFTAPPSSRRKSRPAGCRVGIGL